MIDLHIYMKEVIKNEKFFPMVQDMFSFKPTTQCLFSTFLMLFESHRLPKTAYLKIVLTL